MAMPAEADESVMAQRLRQRFPTRELIVHFVRAVLPVEARLLPEGDMNLEDFATSAARLLLASGIDVLPDDSESVVGVTVGVEGDRGEPGEGKIVRLPNYEIFFAACCKELASSDTVRLTIVGPTFLEPQWWHDREHAVASGPDFSQDLSDRISEGSLSVVEVILRNNAQRYASGLVEYVSNAHEWKQLIDEMLVRSYELFGNRGERGPRIRCFDPGFAHLPHIFDHTVLIGTRRSPTERVSGGWKIVDTDLIALERERWGSLFVDNNQSQEVAVRLLRRFLEDLRDDYAAFAT